MKFKTAYSFDFVEAANFERPTDKPSMTVPDMSLSVREILDRFTSNTLPPIAKTAYYDENPSFEDELPPIRIPDYDLADASIALVDLESRKMARENNHSAELLREKKDKTSKKVDDGQTPEIMEKVDGKSADS